MSEWGLEDDYYDINPSTATANNEKGGDSGTPRMTEEGAPSQVDGVGMWKSWMHNYEDPKFACLDLLDNCFDATLSNSASTFQGKISMDYLPLNGITILNNSRNPIKDLGETLTAYRSAKNKTTAKGNTATANTATSDEVKKDVIGEYGVGLKQACATLSNVSFVLTKNHCEFQLGVIAEALQTTHSVSLPHYTFSIDPYSDTDIEEQFNLELQKITKDYPNIFHLLTHTLGRGNRKEGVQALKEKYEFLYEDGEWGQEDHLFLLILTSLNATKDKAARTTAGMKQHPAQLFLEDIRKLLPKHYINIPQRKFKFTIQDKPVHFTYWPHRLVEMTKFQVHINKERPLHTIQNFASNGYPLSIYCGFDAIRLLDRENNQAKTCQLNIYSRKSGRLIETTDDAREMLGMTKSGSDFSQGLTIIVDDVEGELPLKPTKDGLTWSKEIHGKFHKTNLLAWIGAVGRLYWRTHHEKFQKFSKDPKLKMGEAIRSFAEAIEKRIQEYVSLEEIDPKDPALDRLEVAQFTEFADVNWQVRQNTNTRKATITAGIAVKKVAIWPKRATVWRFNKLHYPKPNNEVEVPTQTPQKRNSRRDSNASFAGLPGKRKARRTSVSSTASRRTKDDESSSREEEEVMSEIPSPGLAPKKMAFASPEAVRGLSRDLARDRKAAAKIKTPRKSSLLRSFDEEADASKAKKLEKSLEASQNEVEKLRADLNQARRQVMNPPVSDREQSLERALQQAQQEAAQVRQENTRLQENTRQYESSQQSMQSILQENAQLKQQKQQWEQDQRRASNLQQSLQQVMQENRQLKLQSDQLEQSLLHLQQEQQQSSTTELELQKSKEEVGRLRLQLGQMRQNQQQASTLQASFEAVQRENYQLQQHNAQLQQKVKKEGSTGQDLLQRNASLVRQMEEMGKQRAADVARLKLEIDGLKLDLEQRQKTIDRMTGAGNCFSWGGGTDHV